MFIAFLLLIKKINKIPQVINEPFLPIYNQEYSVKKINKSLFNLSHQRYHFQEKYNKRKLFKINYSYYPYTKISQDLSFEDNALIIFNSTGLLNIKYF